DARPMHRIALAPDAMDVLDAADGMHRVEVRQHENARPVAAPGRAAGKDVGEAIDTGRALDLGAERAELLLDKAHHLVDRDGIVARALDLDPFDDTLQDFVGINARFVLEGGVGHSLPPRGRSTPRSGGMGAGATARSFSSFIS